MTKFLAITFAVFATAAIAFAADNSLGTWKYNASKSEQPAGVLSPIKNLTLTREAVNGGVKTSVKGERADGSKIDVTTISKYDGKEVPVPGTGTPWDTVASRQADANTFTEERTKKSGNYHATARFVVSADGKTMNATSEGTGSDGKTFKTVSVWEKQ